MAMILKAVGPSRGAYWVRDGLRLYTKRPLAFTSLFVLFLFAALFSALVPLIGGVLQMMLVPLLSLGFMVASQSALLNGPVVAGQMIEPLRGPAPQRRSLLILCVAYGALVAAALLLSDQVADGGFSRALQLMRSNAPQAEIDALLTERSMVTGTLFGAALLAIITVPFWHAPALVHWAKQSAGQALFSSTLAVWRSRGAFLVYTLTWCLVMMGTALIGGLVFSLLGLAQLASLLALPVGLFFSTMFYVSLIFTFNDSFSTQA